jgi:hypothetical protein
MRPLFKARTARHPPIRAVGSQTAARATGAADLGYTLSFLKNVGMKA